jgi:transposase-like protein
MSGYTKAFKSKVLQKMMGSNSRSATTVAAETGVPQPTLSRWLREATSGASEMTKQESEQTAVTRPRRPDEWTAEERLQVVMDAARLSETDLGAFLRSRGLHEAVLAEWRAAAVAALRNPSKTSPEARRVRELEKELARKEKALAEAAALLVLKKKVQAIWGDEDDSTPSRSDG